MGFVKIWRIWKEPSLMRMVWLQSELPAATGHLLTFRHLRNIASHHGLAKVLANFGKNGCVLIMCDCLDNGIGALGRVTAFEDARTNKHAIHTELHHQCGISRSSYATRCEIHNGQATEFF